jgi:tRNA U38,U39,U40 pseudouridine synthase TruA
MDAVPLRYSEPRFQTTAPIELDVEKVEITSEFVPSFTRPNVEHLFPVSIEKAAKLWAKDRLKAGKTAPACGLYLNKVFY